MQAKWLKDSYKTVGKSHLSFNPPVPCQDSVLSVEENGVNIIALSDGCGSSKISHYGSNVTTRTLVSVLSTRFDEISEADDEKAKKIILDAVISEIKNLVKRESSLVNNYIKEHKGHKERFYAGWEGFKTVDEVYPLTLFDATVQFVAIKDDRAIVGRLGDGIIGYVYNETLTIVSTEDKVGVSKNATWYPSTLLIASENPNYDVLSKFELIRLQDASEIDAFIISSDGLEDVLINNSNRVCTFNINSIKDVFMTTHLDELVENDYKKRHGIDDDLSLGILVRPFVNITKLGRRIYDEEGNTISNNETELLDYPVILNINKISLDEESLAPKKEELINNLNELLLEKINDFIFDEEFKKYFVTQTSKLINLLKISKNIEIEKLKNMLKSSVDELDFNQLLRYWIKLDIVELDEHKKSLTWRDYNE